MNTKITTHYPWLDLTRFIAAFMVLCSHVRGGSFVEYGSLPDEQHNPLIFGFYFITRWGHEAVLAFFVLSGFLVGGNVIKRLQQGTFDIKSYAIDRFVRIMLPLVSTLLLIVCINAIVGYPNNPLVLIGNLFSLQGIFVSSATDPLWSLSYEVWFYVLIGSIACLIARKNNTIVSYLIIFVIFLIFTKLETVYLFVWLMGSLLVLFDLRKNRFVLIFSMIMVFLSICLLQVTSDSRSVEFSFLRFFPSRNVIRLIFSLFMSLMVGQLLLFPPQRNFAIIIDKIGTHLAKFSYTLYLTHYPLILLFEHYGYKQNESISVFSIFIFIAKIFICLIVAYVIYLFFEKHTFTVKKYFKRMLL